MKFYPIAIIVTMIVLLAFPVASSAQENVNISLIGNMYDCDNVSVYSIVTEDDIAYAVLKNSDDQFFIAALDLTDLSFSELGRINFEVDLTSGGQNPFLEIQVYENIVYLNSERDQNFSIFDFTNTQQPLLTNTLDIRCESIEVNNHRLFIYDSDSSLRIYDITDADSPSLLALHEGFNSHRSLFKIYDNLLVKYVEVYNNRDPDYYLELFNISDPEEFILLSDFGTSDRLRDIVVVDDLLITSRYHNMTAYDISNPNDPTFVNELETDGAYINFTYNGASLFCDDYEKGLSNVEFTGAGVNSLTNVYQSFQNITREYYTYGDLLFCPSASLGLYVLDISNPDSPYEINQPMQMSYYDKSIIIDDYMYVTDYRRGIKIVDISDPYTPEDVDYLNYPGSGCFSLTNDTLYYFSTEVFCILDVSNPQSPEEIGYYSTPFDFGEIIDFIFREDIAYVLSYGPYNWGSPSCNIFDYSDLSSPTFISQPFSNGNRDQIIFLFNDTYLATYSVLYDISDLNNPQYIRRFNEDFNSNSLLTYIDDTPYAVSSDWNGETYDLKIYNISDPILPQLVTTTENFTHVNQWNHHDDHIFSKGFYGLGVVDITDINSPVVTGEFDYDFFDSNWYLVRYLNVKDETLYVLNFDDIVMFDCSDALFSIEDLVSNIPETFSVDMAYPNPFNPSITVSFSMPNPGEVAFTLYNINGQQLFKKTQSFSAGNQTFSFNTKVVGASIASGMYLLNVNHRNQTHTQRIMLVK
jgi:hypothetical protein